MRLPIPALLTCALAMAACNGESATATAAVTIDTLPGGIVRTMSDAPVEAGRWALVPERIVQPAEDSDGELLNPSEILLADDGHVLTFEQGPGQIRVYGPDGEFLRAIGRNGKGPGEFSAGMIALRGDTVAVQDPMNQRLSIWNWRSGTLLSERRSVCCVWASMGIDGSGNAWVPRMAEYPDSAHVFARAYLRMVLTGDAADSVFALERAGLPRPQRWVLRSGEMMMMSMSVPLQPDVYTAVDPTGGLISGYSGEYSLRSSTDGVDTTAIFGRRFEPKSVAAAEKQALVDSRVSASLRPDVPFDEAALRQAFQVSAIPDRRPAWEGLWVDRRGRRWLRLSTGDSTRVSFDLFDREGRWLDTVHVTAETWPTSGYPRTAWGRDHVAVTAEGEDGRPLIRVYGILRR